jgi:hypothetical protein
VEVSGGEVFYEGTVRKKRALMTGFGASHCQGNILRHKLSISWLPRLVLNCFSRDHEPMFLRTFVVPLCAGESVSVVNL